MRYFRVFLIVIMLIFGFIPAEAATVAVLPLINRAHFASDDVAKEPGMIYYSEAAGIIKAKEGFMLTESDRLRHAVATNVQGSALPTKEQMQLICKKANVDIIIGMILTDYNRRPARKSVREMAMELNVKGKIAAYNRLNGKYMQKNCSDTSSYDASFDGRYNKVRDAWRRIVRSEFERLLRNR